MSIKAAFIVPHPPIILPAVGRGEEKKISATTDSYRAVAAAVAEAAPETIVLTSPHSVMYRDYFHISPGKSAHGDMAEFRAKSVSVDKQYDCEFVKALSALADKEGLPAGTLGEKEARLDHGTVIPLSFIDEAYTDYKLVRIGLSGLGALEHYRLGKLIARTAEQLNRRVVFIASGDLSHKLKEDGPYGFAAEGPVFDSEVTAAMADGDFLKMLSFPEGFCSAAAECGLKSFQIMAGALDGLSVESRLLSYEGPFGVGYGVASFIPTGSDKSRRFDEILMQNEARAMSSVRSGEDGYVSLARHAVEYFISNGSDMPLPGGLPDDMTNRRAGVFVSLKKDGELRGCIGTISPTEPSIALEIIRNARLACSEDPRFMPVEKDELPHIIYSVDVLGETERIASPDELDVKRYGVIVSYHGRRGLLLPNLEGVDTVSDQIDIARRKGGIAKDDSYTLERFEVVRHK